jgi:HAMP domain-containing protein
VHPYGEDLVGATKRMVNDGTAEATRRDLGLVALVIIDAALVFAALRITGPSSAAETPVTAVAAGPTTSKTAPTAVETTARRPPWLCTTGDEAAPGKATIAAPTSDTGWLLVGGSTWRSSDGLKTWSKA